MLRQRLTYAFMLLTDLAVFVYTNSRIPLIFAAVMIAAPIISYIFLRIAANTVKIDFDAQDVVTAGNYADAEITVYSKFKIYPGMISCKRRVRSVMFDFEKEVVIEHETGGGTQKISAGFTSLFCGAHEFMIYDIKFYDVFRLFRCSSKAFFKADMMMNPHTVKLRVIGRSSSAAENDGVIYDKFRRGSDKSEVFDVREYVRGDDIRSIHWKLSSKLGRTVIREFSRPNNYSTMILCDFSLMTGGKAVSAHAISNSISIGGAVSSALIKDGIGHSICALGKNISEVTEVNSLGDVAKMRSVIMHVKLEKGEFDTAYAFSGMAVAAGVSRLIYVAKEFDTIPLLALSSHMDITVVTTNENQSTLYTDEKNGSLEIISLSENELYDVLHTISI